MTEEEKIWKEWFKELSEERFKAINPLINTPAISGLLQVFTDDYFSDTAHFIYELIQNADDTGATKVEFILEKDKLVFKHNGIRHFSISDPKKEADKTIKLGDINSITAFANSSKPKEGNTIGKFGTGFKSVFQYTSTPRIYDKNFRFEIKNYIVPEEITNDYKGRKEDETIFEFPFNGKKKLEDGSYKDVPPEESYKDISNKLHSLLYPSMFLNYINEIIYTTEEETGLYKKIIIKSEDKKFGEDTTAEFIKYNQDIKSKTEDIKKEQRFWKFNRKIPEYNNLTSSVVFEFDEKEHLKPIEGIPAFCFFPTKQKTNLKFLINAPFLLTANRENIKSKEKNNRKMIEILSQLAGDSLVYLRDIGEEKGIRYIDDNILDILPLSESAFYCNENEQISFLPFYTQMKNKFETEKLLPTKNGYVTKENAYWSDSKMIKELFSNEQIGTIFGNSAEWVFFDRNDNYGDCYSYIKDIVKYIADYDILNNITSGFIENQSIEWLDDFYDWIKSNKDRRDSAKRKPIFLNQYKEAVSAFQDGKLNLFLPSNDISFECNTVYLELLKCKSAKNLLKELDIREPNIQDELEVVFKKYENYEYVVPDNTFKMLFEFFEKVKIIPQNSVFYKFKDKKIFKCYSLNKNVGIANYDKASELYFPSDDLKEYFKTKPSTKFLDIEYYKKLVKADEKKLKEFLDNFEVCNFPKVIKIYRSISYILDNYSKFYMPHYKKDVTYWEYSMDGLQEFLDSISLVDNKEKRKKSILLWNYLIKIISDLVPYKNKDKDIKLECINNFLCISCEYLAISYYYTFFLSSILTKQIVSTPWLLTKNNELKAPSEIDIDELSDIYEQNRISIWNFNKLVEFLGIKKRKVISIDDEINNFTEQLGGKEKVKQILKEFLERQREKTTITPERRK